MLKIKNEYKLILDIIDEVHKSIAFNVNTNAERKKLKIVIDNSQLFRMICYKEIKTSRDNHFNRSIIVSCTRIRPC